MKGRSNHGGIWYFNTRSDAEQYAKLNGFERVVGFQLGYAVQLHRSGPYAGPHFRLTESMRHTCQWCEYRHLGRNLA